MTTVRERPPQTPLPQAWQLYPAVHIVTARSGRQRLLLLVRCGHCHEVHQHIASIGFTHGTRKAACGYGKYVLLVRASEVAA